MEATVGTRVATAITCRQAKVLQVKPEGQKTACILSEAQPVQRVKFGRTVDNLEARNKKSQGAAFRLSQISRGGGSSELVW